MVSCPCPKCAADIKYILTREGNIVVEPDHIEMITDRGRVIQGHLKHKCKGKKEADNDN